MEQCLKILPRLKQDGTQPIAVVLSNERIKELFSLPLEVAAQSLGVCPSSLKW
jgi:hypothetical protein